MKRILLYLLFMASGHMLFAQLAASGSKQTVELKVNNNSPSFYVGGEHYLSTPEDGLWSIATGWEKQWPANWQHSSATEMQKSGDWTILSGEMQLEGGKFILRDAYRPEGNRIKCIRRLVRLAKIKKDKIITTLSFKLSSIHCATFAAASDLKVYTRY